MSCQDVTFTSDKRQFGNNTGLAALSALEELVGKMNQVPRKIKADPREGRVGSSEEELKNQNEHKKDITKLSSIEEELKNQKNEHRKDITKLNGKSTTYSTVYIESPIATL
jgi:hypothetical protein